MNMVGRMPSRPDEIEAVFSERQATDRPADGPARIGPTNGMTPATRVGRSAGVVRWISAALMVIAVFVLIGALPVVRGIEMLWSSVADLGFLLRVGLPVTVTVAVCVWWLSRRAVGERTRLAEPPRASVEQAAAVAMGWPWGTTVLAVLSAAMLAIAAGTYARRDALKNVFGPARVTLHEAYERHTDGPTIEHSAFDALLGKHVDKDGWVDYAAFRGDAATLDVYITLLGKAPFADLGRDEKLSLLINAYNAFTLRLILDHYPVKSIKDIPSAERWDAKRWRLGSMTLSLNQIEHEQIRPRFAEPRVHFALVCAAIGCPKLRNEAYRAERIEEQLEDQTRYVHSHDRWFRYQPGANEVYLTKLYDWYGSDFAQIAGSVPLFASRYSTPFNAALREDKPPRIRWLDYDWMLNDRRNAR